MRHDFAHIADEAHVQHAVGFVDDEESRQLSRRTCFCCTRSSRRPGVATRMSTPCFMALTWRVLAHAAQDHGELQVEKAAIGAQALFDLHRQLARGRQDQGLGFARTGRHMADGKFLQQRQAKCGGLAGAGLGDAQEIAPGEQRREWRGPGWGWGWCNSRPQARGESARQRQARRNSSQSLVILKTGRPAPPISKGARERLLPSSTHIGGNGGSKNVPAMRPKALCGRPVTGAISGMTL